MSQGSTELDLVCWDIGGTLTHDEWVINLFDPVPEWAPGYKRVLERNDAESKWKTGELALRDVVQLVAAELQAPEKDILAAMHSAASQIHLFHNAEETLKRCSGVGLQACVTASPDLF